MILGLPQVDRPWSQLLKLECEEQLSKVTFNFNLCRYMKAEMRVKAAR
jgi:hypothetical protein